MTFLIRNSQKSIGVPKRTKIQNRSSRRNNRKSKELKREILSINKNKLKKEVKERKKNVVAIRFSDGEIQAFLRKISERNSEKNQISPDKPMSEQKLEVPSGFQIDRK